jgi:PAS domain S-box-containing protein
MSDQTLARDVIHAVAPLSDATPVLNDVRVTPESENTEEMFLDSILENLPYMVFVKDAVDLRFVRFNRAGEDLLGYSREEMIGLNDYDLFPREEADAFTKKDREVLANGGVAEISEEPVHTQHLGTRTLRTKKIPILGKDGTPKYLLGISEDVTQQRRKEHEVADLNGDLERRTRELENAVTELESVSYSVSHDLRSPLRALDGFGHFLLENHAEVLDEAARDALDRIRGATQTMGGVIDGVLSLTRLARTKVHNAEVDLTATAERVMAELCDNDGERNVRFAIRKKLKQRGDPRLLRELLEHLLQNAWKFTGGRGADRVRPSGR